MATVEERVASGAYMLDIHRPGWREEIDLERLDTRSCANCVLGQLFGTYEQGLDKLGVWDEAYNPGDRRIMHQSMLGFGIDLDEADNDLMPDNAYYSYQSATDAFARLDRAWKIQVLA